MHLLQRNVGPGARPEFALKSLVGLVGLALASPAWAVCTGNVTIGEGATQIATPVPNKAVGGVCLNDLIVDTFAEGANYGSHGEFVVALTKQAIELVAHRELTVLQGFELLSAGARSDVGKTIDVRILAFNDFHGNLLSPGSFGVQAGGPGTPIVNKASGGVDFLAGYVAAAKAGRPNTVVVSAGDLIGASPLVSALFHDEPTIETMNRLGLEFNAVGNHEFDEGSAELLRMQNGGCHPTDANSCKGAVVGTPVPFEGAKFQYLSANVVESATGHTLFPAFGVKSFKGHPVAFIGMTLAATPTIVTPSGVAGLEFKDEADTVNALVPRLRREGIKAIVVLLHQGGFQGANSSPSGQPSDNFINDCKDALQDPTTSPIKDIVSRLDDAVDIVISGHTHTGYNCRLPNKVGRMIPVTQASAFGRVLTEIDMTLDTAKGDVVDVAIDNRTVDRTSPTITPNATIKAIVNAYNGLVSPIANAVIGSITADLPNSGEEMPAGDLIADAQLAATQPAQFGGAQVAFMNRGGVRNPGFLFSQISGGEQPGDVTYGEAFTVQPFGNSLVTMTVTAQQLRDFLEQQFAGCAIPGEPAQTADRILQVSSGFKFSFSTAAAPCSKIQSVSLGGADVVAGGQLVVAPTSTYRITVNNFMSTGGDGFTVLTHGTNLLGGAQDIDALVAYFSNFRSPNPPYDPTAASLNKPRITSLP
jgi:5'-nucleotidase